LPKILIVARRYMLDEQIITISGRDIKYLERPGSGPTILFLPGIGGTHKEWAKVIGKLAKCFSAVSVSLPPYGKNDNLESLPELVNEFIEKMNLNKVILVGHSLGGLIALRVSALYPQTILKTVIVASPLPDIEKRALVRGILPRFSSTKSIEKLTHYYGDHKNIINNLARFLDYGQGSEKKMNDEEWSKLVYCMVDIVNHPWVKDIQGVRCPALIVYGNEDRALLFFNGTELYAKFKNAVVMKISGDHRLPRNKPEELALMISGFSCQE